MAIIISKSGDEHRIDLPKNNSSFSGEIKINLDWSKGGGGFFKRLFLGDTDLDLGCFYELRNGKKQLIDGLQFAHGQGGHRNMQTRQGCYDKEPYIWHTGDDRSGGEGETILVNPAHINDLKRIIVYTFIYEGAAKWAETNAVVKVSVPGNEDVIVEMGQQTDSRTFCAIAELDFDGNNSITVKKLVTFHNGHSDCDKMYGWGFKYHAGSK